MKGYVYKITNPAGNVYVGSTKNLRARMNHYSSVSCKSQSKLYNSFVKYGFVNHIVDVIWEGDWNDMYFKEREFGLFFNVLDRACGLNLKLPDEFGRPSLVSKEVGEAISKAVSGKRTGKNNSFYGKKHSQESKDKMGEIRSRMFLGSGNPNYGNKWTDEQKESMRIKQKALKREYTPEQRKKRSDSAKLRIMRDGCHNKGRKASEETKLKFRMRIGELNPASKIFVNVQNGIFYFGMKDAAQSLGMSRTKLKYHLRIAKANNTNIKET